MQAYDDEAKTGTRGDFLEWLRAEQVKNPQRMSQRDIVNHLSNNLYIVPHPDLFLLLTIAGSQEATPLESLFELYFTS